MADMKQVITNVMDNYYDLGKIVEIKKIPIGQMNESFSVKMEKDGKIKKWFFRYYSIYKTEPEINYELGLMFHLRKKGFLENACPALTKDGKTHLSITVDGEKRYCAIQEWLEGSEPYGWEYCPIKDAELEDVARVVARIHNLAADFVPASDYVATRPPIEKHVAGYPKNLRFWIGEVHKRGGKEHYYQYMNSRMPKIEDWIHRILPMMETATELPRTHIHTDAHPGNFKFDNDKVVGVFDFDWVQVDFRIYEVAFVLTTFGSDWYWDTNGVHFMNRMKIVLDAYNDEVSKIDGMIGKMNQAEWDILPDMMIICNILMLQESAHQIYDDPERNQLEYLYYMAHCVQAAEWIDWHRDEILDLQK